MSLPSGPVVPGQRIGDADLYRAGAGTYERGGRLYATLVGVARVRDEAGTEALAKGLLPILEVKQGTEKSLVPTVGSVVTARVRSVNRRFAKVEIVCVDGRPLLDSFRGMIRVQDIRATEKDKVEVYRSFRPADILLARVISLGDARSYYLATDANHLGVIHATGASGHVLVPISWCQMQCPVTGLKEDRKVARVAVDLSQEVAMMADASSSR